uniref:Zinc finger, RAN-binding domain containing 3 n=1 Tax=Esox lucius TaxID=8010 RepID=A0A6Q2XWK7_ESOLU
MDCDSKNHDSKIRWDNQLSVLPDKLRQRLMPFQKEGVKFALSKNGRYVMGLGKTIQAISVAYAYRQEWPLLVVVPSSLKYPWIEEMERWIPELNPGDINLVETKSDTLGIGSCKVTVLGYGLLTTDARGLVDALTRQKFDVVVVDESHYLKSRNAARSKILVPLIQRAKRAILLTGTPALGRPEELFMQIDALYPGMFGTWSDYAKQFCNAHYRFFGNRRQWDCRGASHLKELHQRLREIMIRRLKAQVLPQLPPKIRQRIPFNLPKDAAKEASGSLEEWERLMKTVGSGVSATDNPFTEVMGLATRMYKQTAIAKAGAVKDYIKMLLETEKLKFLVFAHHLTMLQACTEAVIEAKAGYIRIDGSVPSSERIQLVHRFQNDPETRVAILSIQAAGQGLTFTAATHVVFAELCWSPGHVKQAEDRAHRIGQTASIHVHYLIAKGTFDTVLWGMLNRKETITGSTLNGKKEYLNAKVGDKDKWEFLNFSEAWTPSEMTLTGGGGDADKTTVFFNHFEKDKQHDIRSFFSPGSSKKRKRTEEDLSRSPVSPAASSAKKGSVYSEADDEEEQKNNSQCHPVLQDPEFSPQVQRLCFPAPRSCPAARRRSLPNGSSPSGSPLAPMFAPRLGNGQDWSCGTCTYSNSTLLLYCEMCESPRPKTTSGECNVRTPTHTHTHAHVGRCNIRTSLPLYLNMRFCASMHTDRVYVYSQEGSPLHCNFIPLDIKLDCWEDLPEPFSRRRENRTQILRLVQQWFSLTAMKQRLLRRSGLVFHSPVSALDQLTHSQHNHNSTKRYLTKEDVTQASVGKVQREGGSVRVIRRDSFFAKRTSSSTFKDPPDQESPCEDGAPEALAEAGCLQAMDSEGRPLCLSCHQACGTAGGTSSLIGKICSAVCQEEFQLRSSQSHMRARVLQTEQGVCQGCGLQAHQLYLKVRDAPPTHRKEMLENTWLAQLSLKQLNEMIRAPVEGQFWQVDHIRPVYSGGGQCSLDNLQTLCTVCHKTRTAQQAKERSKIKKGLAASKVSSDITRFFVKK